METQRRPGQGARRDQGGTPFPGGRGESVGIVFWGGDITSGYRPPTSSAVGCILSFFQMTDEAVNIWTHFLPICFSELENPRLSKALRTVGSAYPFCFDSLPLFHRIPGGGPQLFHISAGLGSHFQMEAVLADTGARRPRRRRPPWTPWLGTGPSLQPSPEPRGPLACCRWPPTLRPGPKPDSG
ncbi:membrane progestin receptor delta [Ornithorhynchus anatinus]|uniref:membrane progestin receptor delta n=1 Tax=Ornithorhynchus anatinus TaxID=9258 RepID=UPI0010A82C5A|nr:membrane progestin receptor delta [Ornithorhynchus anatinus]